MNENKRLNSSRLKIANMKEKEIDIWTLSMILGALAILIWAILKAIKVIESPTWIEMIPYFGGSISIIGGAYKLGKIKKGIEQTDEKVDKLIKIEERFNKVETEHKLVMNGKLDVKHR